MIAKIILWILLFPCAVFSTQYKQLLSENTDSAQQCYNQVVSASIEACMNSLEYKTKRLYNKQFAIFTDDIQKDKDSFINYKDFITAIQNAKKDWDNYIVNECAAKESLFEKNNYGSQIIKSDCLIQGYQQRIIYYKNYQFD